MPKKDDSMEVDGEDKETEEERQIRDEKIKVNKKIFYTCSQTLLSISFPQLCTNSTH